MENLKNGDVKSGKFVHLSDLPIAYVNVAKISQTGRFSFQIENEGFNVQKNQGYNLKHKYSRKNLTACKNYYQCLQMGHLLNQLVEKSNDFKELFTNGQI